MNPPKPENRVLDTEGYGYGWSRIFLSPKGAGPYKNAFEIGMTRLAATFTPSFMNGINWWTSLLHTFSYGPRLMAGFWNSVDSKTRTEANFQRKSLKDFDKLSPHSP